MTHSPMHEHTLESTVIEVHELSKRYGAKLVVDSLSFTVQPGRVTGFLGPNGAGKSTTMRLIVGLDHPASGSATIGGKRYPLAQLLPGSLGKHIHAYLPSEAGSLIASLARVSTTCSAPGKASACSVCRLPC